METIEAELIANLSGPVRNMIVMAIGVMLLYGLSFYAFDKLKEVMEIGAGNALKERDESLYNLQMKRNLKEKHKGTAEGDVYAYEYGRELREYSSNRNIDDERDSGRFGGVWDEPDRIEHRE